MHRFDPPSGRFRVRYAANRPDAAVRERFPSRVITDADGHLQLIRLDGSPAALHLTHQTNLDALGVDDRISTGRLPTASDDPLLAVAPALSDAVYDWWRGEPPPLVHRTRSVPSARSMAFTAATGWDVTSSGPLRDAVALLAHLVIRHGFSVPQHWLA